MNIAAANGTTTSTGPSFPVWVAHSKPVFAAGLALMLARCGSSDIQIWDGDAERWSADPGRRAAVVFADTSFLRRVGCRSGDRLASDSPLRIVWVAGEQECVDDRSAWPKGICAALPVECRESDLADVMDEVSRDTVSGTPLIVARPPRGGLASGALRRVKQHIDQHLSEAIKLNELAQIAELSACHFARAFKESVGIAPHRFMTVRRIAAACRLLAEGDDALIQIALEVGFCDQSHFTRCFARFVGVTPSAYRRRYR
jgi:AraC-like DNA-binding protein